MCLCVEEALTPAPYLAHLQSLDDLVTTYEAIRAGFLALALEKNRKASRLVGEARALQAAALAVGKPGDLRDIGGIRIGLLTASGLSDKSLNHLSEEDKETAIDGLIKEYLEPAGERFVEELVFRFLLVRGDSLGGSMRNMAGTIAHRKFVRAVVSALSIAGVSFRWQHPRTRTWLAASENDVEIEEIARGLTWQLKGHNRTLLFNLTAPIVKNNVDICLLNLAPTEISSGYRKPESYLALGELKGGIDPAGADEHWKTARSALERIRASLTAEDASPATFFIGAAIERRMAGEIWEQLQNGHLSNAANLNNEMQLASIAQWLCGWCYLQE
ncbi:MAG: restriction endonuclease [Caldilineaceae bacterium]|nr:restriction endonuclease [Caldilineaceae bacterium]